MKLRSHTFIFFELPSIIIPRESFEIVPTDPEYEIVSHKLTGISCFEISLDDSVDDFVYVRLKFLFQPLTDLESKLLDDLRNRSRKTIDGYLERYQKAMLDCFKEWCFDHVNDGTIYESYV